MTERWQVAGRCSEMPAAALSCKSGGELPAIRPRTRRTARIKVSLHCQQNSRQPRQARCSTVLLPDYASPRDCRQVSLMTYAPFDGEPGAPRAKIWCEKMSILIRFFSAQSGARSSARPQTDKRGNLAMTPPSRAQLPHAHCTHKHDGAYDSVCGERRRPCSQARARQGRPLLRLLT